MSVGWARQSQIQPLQCPQPPPLLHPILPCKTPSLSLSWRTLHHLSAYCVQSTVQELLAQQQTHLLCHGAYIPVGTDRQKQDRKVKDTAYEKVRGAVERKVCMGGRNGERRPGGGYNLNMVARQSREVTFEQKLVRKN